MIGSRAARWVLVGAALVTALAAPFAARVRIDASSDSLLMRSDRKLAFYREIRERYGSDNALIIAFTPREDLLSESSLDTLRDLTERLRAIPAVADVTSILDVPMVHAAAEGGPGVPEKFPRLDDVEPQQARHEFRENPFYANRLVSTDGRTSAVRVEQRADRELDLLLAERQALRENPSGNGVRLAEVEQAIDDLRAMAIARQRQTVREVREAMQVVGDDAAVFLGGVSMIVTDMIRFIERDLMVFGALIGLLTLFLLTVFFRRARYVALPAACCAATAVLTGAVLSLVGWEITVISANVLPLLLILTLSLAIHVVVQVRDRLADEDASNYRRAVADGSRYVAAPCVFTVLSTAIAFGSLTVSDIRPVVDLGWYMVVGLCIALAVIFSILPTGLAVMAPAPRERREPVGRRVLGTAADAFTARPRLVLALLAGAACLSAAGIPRLEVENRFIDNFRDGSAIHQGMTRIDSALGGTTPLDVIVSAPASWTAAAPQDAPPPPDFWWRNRQLETAGRIHDVLAAFPTVGKVLSIGSTAEIVRTLYGGEMPSDFELAVMRDQAPDELRVQVFDPFLGLRGNEARFAARILESDPELDRNRLIADIRAFLDEAFAGPIGEVRLTGMLVLYNDMLQSLYRSQRLTIGAVFLAVFVLFLVLFRDFRLASIAMLPNLFACVTILGLMGWLRVPLNMTTITVAAVSVGIAVDDTIHYLHQWKRLGGHRDGGRVAEVIRQCHERVGKAILYTSVVIAAGFATLLASNFVPSAQFGALTATAMGLALIADLALLPAALMVVYGRGTNGSR